MKTFTIKKRIYSLAVFTAIVAALGVTAQLELSTRLSAVAQNAESYLDSRRIANLVQANYGFYLNGVYAGILDPSQKKFADERDQFHNEFVDALDELSKRTKDEEVQAFVTKTAASDKELRANLIKLYEAKVNTPEHRQYYAVFLHQKSLVETSLIKLRTDLKKKYEDANEIRKSTRDFLNKVQLWILIGIALLSSAYALFIAKAISSMLEKIGAELSAAAETVKAVSMAVSDASHELSEATTEQAASIQETVSCMEEMSSMLAQTSTSSKQSNEAASQSQRSVQKGQEVIGKMVDAMDDIHNSNSRLESIVKMIEQIRNKTQVINDIVTETRLLSFNASIEAARAGVHGKGFAVVAEEVGKLASMSGKAAEEIRNLLDTSTSEVSTVVKGTQSKVDVAKNISRECQGVFQAMTGDISKITEAIHMINTATQEQETGVRETNRAMGEMEKVTHKHSTGADALAAQAAGLSTGATNLYKSIQSLKAMIFGTSAVSFESISSSGSSGNSSGQASAQTAPVAGAAEKGNLKLVETKVAATLADSPDVSTGDIKQGNKSPKRSDSRWLSAS